MSDKFLVLDDSSTIHKIELAFPADAVEVVSAENCVTAKDQLRKVSLASFLQMWAFSREGFLPGAKRNYR